MNTELLPISAITMSDRRREDMGDLAGLATSMERHGLMHPIVIDDAGVLVAGGRRLAAAKRLRWEHIDCRRFGTLSETERHELELEESIKRRMYDAIDRSHVYGITPYEKDKAIVTATNAAKELLRLVDTWPRTPPTCWTYFMQMADGPIKIGYSSNPLYRLRSLEHQYGCDLALLGVVFGGYLQEQSFHRRFAHLRLHGEWFSADTELIDFIQERAHPFTGIALAL